MTRHVPFAPSPLQWAYQAATRFMAGDYPTCVAAAESAGDLNANVPGFKAAALHHLGSRAAAAAELERFFAKRMGATTIEIDSSHVPMLSKPTEVLDVIRKATNAMKKA